MINFNEYISDLNISPETIKYSTGWTADTKTIRSKRMDKLYNLACYYFMPSDETDQTLFPNEINPDLCTHLIVAAAEVRNNNVYFKNSFDTEV